MHIPPYHRKGSWQRFFTGAVIGAIIAYFIFVFMYGKMYERLLEANYDLQSRVSELESQNDALLEDKKDLDEKTKELVTIERIEISIINEKQLRLDRLIVHQLEDLIKEDINHIVGQDIKVIDDSAQLLLSAIENKSFPVDDMTYQFEIQRLIIAPTLKLALKAKLSN
ncbi:MAG TPA: sporulation membrane protein YtrI [Virgibacillus sp.]|nr:sporulation membrane protein YtrI [Virgibacillus sp.]